MWRFISRFIGAALCSSACLATELTPTETRWLVGVRPVVEFARRAGMALDIIVQPQPTPGAAPLALAFVGGRCKLVLSMRGNPQAQDTLDRIDPELLGPTLELMGAHELGHCRRYLDGAWYGLPPGFAASDQAESRGMRPAAGGDGQVQRREEGYGDLVGLAWTWQRHPRLYARLHRWLLAERASDRIVGSSHDTLAWVRLAGRGSALAGASLFEAANALWVAGLSIED